MGIVSLSVARVRRTNSPTDWTVLEMLHELARRIEVGEIDGSSRAVMVIETLPEDKAQILAYSAGEFDNLQDAAALIALAIRTL